MWSKKNILIFCAGAVAFHGISHLMMHFMNILPIKVFGIVLNYQLNMYAIIGSALIAIALLWWASRLK